MNSKKDVLNKNAKEILRKILLGESLGALQKEYHLAPDTIANFYRDLFSCDERALELFNSVMERNLKKTSTKCIEENRLRENITAYLAGRLTRQKAARQLGIHEQTFEKKMAEYISAHRELAAAYQAKKARRADYSAVNFKNVAIEMLQARATQRQMEEKYHLRRNVLTKKITEFDNAEDGELYDACKMLAVATMSKRELSEFEDRFVDRVVEKYTENAKENAQER